MESKIRKIKYYEDEKGCLPAYDWLESLKDKTTRIIIKGRIRRLEDGNFGYTRNLGDGIIELKINYGSGYRVYLGLEGDAFVILLAVGDKSSQVNDIKNAKLRWMNRMEKKNEKKKN